MLPLGIPACCLRKIPLGNVDLCLERNRTLGDSVVRYSTEESFLLNCINFDRPYSTEESSLLKRKVEF